VFAGIGMTCQGKWAWKLMERWELALHIAEDCYQKLEEKVSTIKEMEIRSMGALELLTER